MTHKLDHLFIVPSLSPRPPTDKSINCKAAFPCLWTCRALFSRRFRFNRSRPQSTNFSLIVCCYFVLLSRPQLAALRSVNPICCQLRHISQVSTKLWAERLHNLVRAALSCRAILEGKTKYKNRPIIEFCKRQKLTSEAKFHENIFSVFIFVAPDNECRSRRETL